MRTVGMKFQALLAAATCLTGVPTLVMAQTPPAPAPAAPAADAPPPGYWINGIHLSAQIDAGIIGNTAFPKLNIGQSFTDHPNQVQLNQVLLGAEKKLDPKATGFDWGFKIAAFYGSDARYTQYLGIFNQTLPGDRNQFDIMEASGSIHIPVPIFEGGLDVKAGLWATPLGAELIDPSGNPFYSHSYIFNYALPFKHTGFLTTSHVTGMLDIYAGLDTGTNTTFGPQGENNSALAGIVGFGLNLLDGNLTVLALSHMGPENASRLLSPLGFNANGFWRFYNDVVVVYKATDKLTLTSEATWVRDDFDGTKPGGPVAAANGIGFAQYVGYALYDTVTLNARAEIFRDDNGFFVAGFPGNNDPVLAQKGLPSTAFGVPGTGAGATYGAITLGVTFKPVVPAPITSLAIRPEIRYDQSLGGATVFNPVRNAAGAVIFKDRGALTFGTDVILTF
jgi:hypothetical protein